VACAALAAPAACAGPSGFAASPQRLEGLHRESRPPVRDTSSAKDPWLYATGYANNSVVIYDLAQSGFPQIGTISDGVSKPGGVAVDQNGTVYVANQTGTVTIYPAGQSSPSLTLSEDLQSPQSVAVDSNDDVYVCNRGSSPSIVIFPPGGSTPSQIITNSLVQMPNQVQWDASGDLYYVDEDTGLSEIPAGSQTMTSLGLRGLQSSRGLALDEYGNFYVGTYGSRLDGVREYMPGDQRSIRTLRDSEASDLYASGAVKNREYIFIPDSYTSVVQAFKPNEREPSFTVNTEGAETTIGVAIKPARVP
jgi:hypothetical protein